VVIARWRTTYTTGRRGGVRPRTGAPGFQWARTGLRGRQMCRGSTYRNYSDPEVGPGLASARRSFAL